MSKEKNKYNEVMQYAGLATQWLVMLALALWLGIKIDQQISPKSRAFTIALPLLSLTISLWLLVRKFNQPKK